MGFWNFIGKMMLFDFMRKQLFSSGKSSETRSSSVRVRGIVPEREQERKIDMMRGYNEEALDAVDDIESRLDDYEIERYDYLEDQDDPEDYDEHEDDYYSAAGWQSNYDYSDHDDFDDPDHYDFDHYDFLDDDW